MTLFCRLPARLFWPLWMMVADVGSTLFWTFEAELSEPNCAMATVPSVVADCELTAPLSEPNCAILADDV